MPVFVSCVGLGAIPSTAFCISIFGGFRFDSDRGVFIELVELGEYYDLAGLFALFGFV